MSSTKPIRKAKPAQRQRVEQLMSELEKQLANQYILMVSRAKKKLDNESTHSEAVKAIVDESNQYAAFVEQAYLKAGRLEAYYLSRQLGRRIMFDPAKAAPVVASVRRRFLHGFKREQSASISQAIVRANRKSHKARGLIKKAEDKGPAKAALGLTPHQEQIVENYRGALAANSSDAMARQLRDRRFDSTVQGALDNDEPLSWEQIDRMTQRYRERWVVYRAKTIARTTALTVVNSARHEALSQAAEQANFDPDGIVRTWNTMEDDRVRDSHDDLDGEEVEGMDEPWQAAGGPLLYPGDPAGPPEEVINCRCWVTYSLPDDTEEEE